MAMRELPAPRPTFVLARGAYDAPTVRVTPGTPRAVGEFPANLPQNRLGLARWLVNPRHPLTARVICQSLLGGRSSAAGSWPHRQTSAIRAGCLLTRNCSTGSQPRSSNRAGTSRRCRSASCCRPPTGRSRRSRQHGETRIPQTSGSPGGRRIDWRPNRSVTVHWQPAGSSFAPSADQASIRTSRPDLGSARYAQRDQVRAGKGADLYRRSLSTVWKRSSPPPSAISFDAAERLFCTVSRQRTNTPLQSLVLLERSTVSRGLARARPADDRRGWGWRHGTAHHVRIQAAHEPAPPTAESSNSSRASTRKCVRSMGVTGGRPSSCCRWASPSRSHARPRRSRGFDGCRNDDHEFRRNRL